MPGQTFDLGESKRNFAPPASFEPQVGCPVNAQEFKVRLRPLPANLEPHAQLKPLAGQVFKIAETSSVVGVLKCMVQRL